MKKGMVSILVTAAMIFAALPGTATPASGGAEITLTYANFPPASTFPCVQMERYAKEVETRTAGKVKILTFPGGTLLPAKNIFDGVQSGAADIGNFAMSYQPGRFPVSEAVDLPLGFRSAHTASLALYDLIMEYNPKEFANVKILTLFTCPPADFMTSRPVAALADLKGMELRVSGTGAEVIGRLGGIPVAMPQSETPEAIQKGIVKGMVSSREILKDFNFAAYCPYSTDADLFVVSFAVVMNRAKWDALPGDVKEVLDKLGREQAEWTGAYVDNHVEEALAWAKKESGHETFDLSAADRSEIEKAVRPLVDGYVKRVTEQGLPGAEIVGRVLELKKKYE
ncbi:MAG TPA: TRAP transporter substrate-binding protein [Syntrophales bacterium]|nr:TRAP transporter substrate-binding protein [Syntrophales bacterium]HQN77561.1 TRAP transporter substrate-binding protein [Syntrophales bacterium]HQQ26517.1 TRAP transporter substrate-binding protein [Syntrophales bacterium]